MRRQIACMTAAVLWSAAAGFAQLQAVQSTAPAASALAPTARLVKLDAAAKAAPEHALDYQLLPGMLERKAGNAALQYLAILERTPKFEEGATQRLRAWIKAPAASLPPEAGQMASEPWLKDLAAAARRDECDWQLPIREQGIALWIPTLSPYRNVGRLLAMKARVEMGQGRYVEAIEALKTSFSMSRDLAEMPTLMSGLVAMAVADTALDQVEELIRQPGGPNMYWALASLPQPLVDLRKAFDGERSWLIIDLPDLRAAARGEITKEQAAETMRKIRGIIGIARGEDESPRLEVGVALMTYAKAKEYLRDKGMAAGDVESLSVQQAVLMYLADTFFHVQDEMLKWHYLPYWQAHEGLRQADRKLQQAVASQPGNWLLMQLPSLGRASFMQARLDRRVAALMCVESIRMYAAANDGKLPASLDDLKDAPVPLDPVTGKALDYRPDGASFVIDCPAPSGMPASDGVRYEVMIEPAKTPATTTQQGAQP